MDLNKYFQGQSTGGNPEGPSLEGLDYLKSSPADSGGTSIGNAVSTALYPAQAVAGLFQGAMGFTAASLNAAGIASLEMLDSPAFILNDNDGNPLSPSADEWYKNFNYLLEEASHHPLLNPEHLGEGSVDAQALVGSFFHWVEESLAPKAGNAIFEAQQDAPLTGDPELDQNPEVLATAAQTGVNLLALMSTYFGVKSVQAGLGALKKRAAKGAAKEAGDAPPPATNELPPLEYEPTEFPGNFGPRPGNTPSTTRSTTVGGEQVLGQHAFINSFKNRFNVDDAAATKAWYEYANKVTQEAYPDAYIAYEMKASGMDALANPNMTGRQQYLAHIANARNTNNIYGYRNTFKYDKYEYDFKDYIPYTPAEFIERIIIEEGRVTGRTQESIWVEGPQGQRAYVKYINDISKDWGLEPINEFSRSVERAFDLRDMEARRLKAVQEELAWKEQYTRDVLEPIQRKHQDLRGLDTQLPRGLKDVLPSKEGPNYTSEQVQSFFDTNTLADLAGSMVDRVVSRATQPIEMTILKDRLAPQEGMGRPRVGRRKRQGGYGDPDVFMSGVEAVAKYGKEMGLEDFVELPSAAKTSAALGTINFGRESRGLFIANKDIRSESLFSLFNNSSAGEVIGFSTSMDWIRPMAQKSPTLAKILDHFDRRPFGEGRMQEPTFNEAYKTTLAKMEAEVRDAFREAGVAEKGRFGGLTRKQNKQLVQYMRGEVAPHEVPLAVRKAGHKVRNILDRWHKELKEKNIPGVSDKLDYIENYLPRKYSKISNSMFKNSKLREEWVSLFEKYDVSAPNLTPRELGLEIWENLRAGGKPYRVSAESLESFFEGSPHARRASSLDYDRLLHKIPDKELGKFLDDNLYRSLYNYAAEYAQRVSFSERFGANREIFRRELAQAAAELQEQGIQMPRYIGQRLYDLVNALDHNYKAIDNIAAKKLQRGVIAAANIALLPLVTLVSTPELLVPLSKVGLSNFALAIPHTLNISMRRLARKIYRDVPKNIREEIFEATGAALDAVAQERLTSLFAGDASVVDSLTFRAYGLHHFTKASKLAAVNAFLTMVNGMTKAAAKGKIQQWQKKGGFNKAKLQRLEELQNYYNLDLAKLVEWEKAGRPKNSKTYADLVESSLRFAEDTVLTPNPSIVPMWHSIPHLAFIKHLKTFPAMMYNRILKDWGEQVMGHGLQYNLLYTPQVAGTMMGMFTTGFLINQLQDLMRYGGDEPFEKTPVKEAFRAFERVGFLGPAGLLTDTTLYAKYGLFSTIPGPTLSMAGEASIHLSKYLTEGNTQALSRFVSKNMSILGRIEATRDPIQASIADMLQAMQTNNKFGSFKSTGGFKNF